MIDIWPTFLEFCRINYNAPTEEFEVIIIPTFIHDICSAWLMKEVRLMERAQFLTIAESDAIISMRGRSMFVS